MYSTIGWSDNSNQITEPFAKELMPIKQMHTNFVMIPLPQETKYEMDKQDALS